MKRIFSLIAIASLALTQSCSFEEMKGQVDTPKADPYKVQIYSDIVQQPATKVTTDGFCTGDQVGVYLVNYNGATPGTLKVKGNQADNVRFSYDENGNWVSDYDIYYKDNETNVDFYGYYPYADPTSIEAYPFEVARDQSKGEEHGQMAPYEASDFLWANTKNVTPTNSKVVLTFRHQMSAARVRFSQGTGWDDAAEYVAVTKEVLVTNTIRKSIINLATGVVTPEGEVPLTGTIPMNDNGEFRAIVVPQTVAAGKTLLTITIGGRPRHYVRDEDTEYIPGKITTYDFNVNKNPNTGEHELEITGVNITAWEADNVSHGDDAREYVVIHNEILGQLERTVVDRYEMDPAKIKNLKLTGRISAEDYGFMNSKMTSLMRLNLREVESNIDGVYAIPTYAFKDKKTLLKCILPQKLHVIGGEAFSGSGLVGTVNLPEGLEVVAGFSGTDITSINFPSTLVEIGGSAFENCSNLIGQLIFPPSLSIIGSSAFSGAKNIKGPLVLPENLTAISVYAFFNCHNLTGSLTIPSGVKKIGDYAFNTCGFNGTLVLPEGLTQIGVDAFDGCDFTGELKLPESIKVIGDGAFAGNKFSGKLVLPEGVAQVGSEVFKNCNRLSGIVEIPENILAISSGLFWGCGGLDGVVLHKEVEVIESNAFMLCNGLSTFECKSKIPPRVVASSFSGVPKDNFVVVVPENALKLYQTDAQWGEFKRIEVQRDFSISRRLFRTLNASCSKDFIVRARTGESWHVESKPDWVEVSPMSGVGKTDVVVTTTELTRDGGNRIGEVKFVLDNTDGYSVMTVEQFDYQYGDEDVIEYQKASKGDGIDIIIIGDCFDAKDISEGKYIEAMDDAAEYFFELEPYRTYRDYFNVTGVVGMSADSGPGGTNTIKDARFGTQYYAVSDDIEWSHLVLSELDRILNMEVNDETFIMILHNSNVHDGASVHVGPQEGPFTSISILPFSEDVYPFDFRGHIHHHAGGTGFGRLGDERVLTWEFIWDLPRKVLQRKKALGFYDNLSLSGNRNEVDWKHLLYDPQFSDVVDIYEGGYEYARGVYRSESHSIMGADRRPYFNAISRESIVKRIMKYAGEPYTFEEFKANDKESLK